MENENIKIQPVQSTKKSIIDKNKKELKIKLTKFSKNYIKPRCEHFINSMRTLNFRILESSGGQKSVDKEVKESRNFRFGKNKDYFKHLTDLAPFQIELNPFIKNLKKQFTKDEINIIKKNKDFYIQNKTVKDNISLFNDQSLYQILNMEEREERNRQKKVFHNLNYFNKRRKSVIIGLNNNSGNNNSRNNKTDILKNIKLPFYQTSVKNINEKSSKNIQKKNLVNYNLGNLSHYYAKKNQLDFIKKEIRKGFKKMRKEEQKSNLINEKIRKIFFDLERQTQYEKKKLIDEKNNYYRHTLNNEINPFYNKQKNKDKNFPKISYNQTFSTKNFNSLNSDILAKSDKSDKLKTFNFAEKTRKKECKSQIYLYKKRNINERRELKKIEKVFIKNMNGKIKSIYENMKYRNDKI